MDLADPDGVVMSSLSEVGVTRSNPRTALPREKPRQSRPAAWPQFH